MREARLKGFLPKPIDVETFAAAVEALVSGGAT
jgi:DNA-binding NarL/FixJ family response regulator